MLIISNRINTLNIFSLKILPYALLIPGVISPVYAKPLDESLLQKEMQTLPQARVFSNHLSTNNTSMPKTQFMLKRVGSAKNAVVQGIAIDPRTKYIYTTNVTGKPSKGVINRYRLDDKNNKTALDAQQPSEYIGHQGITVEPQSSKLWASAGPGIKNHGWYAVRFAYQPNGKAKNIQTIKLFDKGYTKGTNSMPTFSPDGKYLVARSAVKKDGQSFNIIRVFDTSKFNLNTTTDLSKNYLYEWSVDKSLTPTGFPFQGMATDGKYIYMISGYGNPNNKKLHVYTLQGKQIQNIQNLTLGKHEAFNDGIQSTWEPEGLAVTTTPQKQLMVIFATGDKGKRNARVYSIDIND